MLKTAVTIRKQVIYNAVGILFPFIGIPGIRIKNNFICCLVKKTFKESAGAAESLFGCYKKPVVLNKK